MCPLTALGHSRRPVPGRSPNVRVDGAEPMPGNDPLRTKRRRLVRAHTVGETDEGRKRYRIPPARRRRARQRRLLMAPAVAVAGNNPT
jgi:hypothetical protein